jgi:hypothetical protein
MIENEVMAEIYRAIWTALEGKLYLIGSVVEKDARKLALEQKIYDKGDFYQGIGYLVKDEGSEMSLFVGSNVKHEPYVLGGKVPSWTPIQPLIGWVERKQLHWVDKKSGKALTVEQMAHLIQHKIRARGIEARNIFQEVLDNREQWIYQQFNSIEIRL